MEVKEKQYLALWRQIAEQQEHMARLLEKMTAICKELKEGRS